MNKQKIISIIIFIIALLMLITKTQTVQAYVLPDDVSVDIKHSTKTIRVYGNGVLMFTTKVKKHNVYVRKQVNIRLAPDLGSEIIRVTERNEKLKRIGTLGRWDIIKLKNNRMAFIMSKYTTKKKPRITVKRTDTKLSGARKKRADIIANICIKYYKKYGVLPSVCVAQAFVETGIGTAYNNNNYWGISSNGYGGFPTIKSGCIKYLKVINNGCYGTAPFTRNYRSQITKIIKGGYCQPANNYIANVCSTIRKYRLTDYDAYI